MAEFPVTTTEWRKRITNAGLSGIAFLLALLANSMVDDIKGAHDRNSQMKAVQFEANSNYNILIDSTSNMYEDITLFRQLNTNVVAQALTNPNFIKHSSPESIEVIEQYYRSIVLGNAYRERVEKLRFSDAFLGRPKERVLMSSDPLNELRTYLIEAWKKNVEESSNAIAQMRSR